MEPLSIATAGQDVTILLMATRQKAVKAKNPAAVALGRLRAAQMTTEERQAAGEAGGAARAAALTKKRKSEIARKAAKARWGKK